MAPNPETELGLKVVYISNMFRKTKANRDFLGALAVPLFHLMEGERA
jgi:hypothetical protein